MPIVSFEFKPCPNTHKDERCTGVDTKNHCQRYSEDNVFGQGSVLLKFNIFLGRYLKGDIPLLTATLDRKRPAAATCGTLISYSKYICTYVYK